MSDATLMLEIRRLRDEIDDLRAELAVFKSKTNEGDYRFPQEWGLTAQQRMIVAMLRDYRIVTYRRLCVKIWGETPDQDRMNHIAVMVCKIRKKLPESVSIRTLYSVGYEIDARSQAFLKEASDVDCLHVELERTPQVLVSERMGAAR